jgi:aminoglycoside phosphotransferase (APT) family kinase protein
MPRVPWAELPSQIRSWVADVLGSDVASAVTQPGGFSPGAACRIELADGRRAFVKAVSHRANSVSPGLHRQEAVVTAALPAGVPAARLLGQYDDGEWVALLLTDVAGRSPAQPWDLAELAQVLDALARMHEQCTPSPVATLPSVAEYHARSLHGWRDLAGTEPGAANAGEPSVTQLDDWSRRNLGRLADLEAQWPAASAGHTLLHNDVRADNMLITETSVIFVDWPHACTGAAWFDVVAFAPSVIMQGGPDLAWLLARTPSASAADPDAVTAVAAAVAGYFTRQALLPAPDGIPTVRGFQAAQGEHARAWLRERTGWN